MEKWSVSQVCEFLTKEGFDKEIVELFRANKSFKILEGRGPQTTRPNSFGRYTLATSPSTTSKRWLRTYTVG